MKSATEIRDNLSYFTGTERYYRWSPLFSRFVLTDGAQYLAQNAECYWLMDAIASHVGAYHDQGFALARLKKQDKGWLLTLEDGNDGVLARQEIEFSDFPLDEITLYVCPQDAMWVILLPSEY